MGNPNVNQSGRLFFYGKPHGWVDSWHFRKVSITFTWYVLMIVLMIYYDLCIAPTTTLGSSRNAILLPFYRSCLPIQTTIPGMPRFFNQIDQRSSLNFVSRTKNAVGSGPVEEAHEKQLADLNRLFKKISDDVAWGTQTALPKSWVGNLGKENFSFYVSPYKVTKKYAKVSFPTLKTHLTPPKSSNIQKTTVSKHHQIARSMQGLHFSHFLSGCKFFTSI